MLCSFLNNSKNNSNNYYRNEVNHLNEVTTPLTVDTYGSQQENKHSNCYDLYDCNS